MDKCPKCGGIVRYDGPYCWPLTESCEDENYEN